MTEEQALTLFQGLADRSRLQILKSLLEEDIALTQKASHIEEEIDQKEHEIETLCLRLLLQQQPRL